MKRFLLVLALLLPLPAYAQQTKAALTTEVNTNFATGVPGGITAATLRTTMLDILNSIMPTAPVVNDNLACFDGTTGLLKDCTVAGTPITALTGDVTATGPGSVAATLATVNANVGAFGSASVVPTFTVNGKGLITAASNATIALPVGQITGLGTGVATALAANVGSAGAPVVNGGALGTPASGVATNLTGTAAGLTAGAATVASTVTTNANLTGPVTSVGNATAVTNNAITNAMIRQGVARSVVGVTGNATANVADIQGAAGQILAVNSAGTSLAFVGPGQTPGEPSTGSATAGNVGEYIESILASGSATSLTTTVPKTITSISLTAGDWDVDGAVYFIPAATTSVTRLTASSSLTTNTTDTTPGRLNQMPMAAVVSGGPALTALLPIGRFSLSATTTVFLVADQAFTVSTLTGFGIIRARRVR